MSYILLIQDVQNKKKVDHEIIEDKYELNYEFVISLIQDYFPQADLNNCGIMYFFEEMWKYVTHKFQIKLPQDLPKDQRPIKTKVGRSSIRNPQIMTTKYFLRINFFTKQRENPQNQQLKTQINQDCKILQDKLINLQRLYSELKYKFEWEPLDINIYWSNPYITDDNIRRKPIKGKNLMSPILKNSLNYAPYINLAINLIKKSEKKVHLKIDPLNLNSFSNKNIFKVVYIICHTEIIEREVEKQDLQLSDISEEIDEINDQMIKIQTMKDPQLQYKRTTMIQDDDKWFENIDIEEDVSLKVHYSDMTNMTRSTIKKENKKKKKKLEGEKKQKTKKVIQGYFVGECKNGLMEKISPEKLDQLLQNKKGDNIEVLILHTSYPYFHLPLLQKHANNIILINSNPLYPDASSVYFLQQILSGLLYHQNLIKAYEQTILKVQELLRNKKSEDIMIPGTQKNYNHQGFFCCCCYHQHERICHTLKNNRPTRYAEYHYRYHRNRCQCEGFNEMKHSCAECFSNMAQTYKKIDKTCPFDQYYYCCCSGRKKKKIRVKNEDVFKGIYSDNYEDVHSIRHKFDLVKCNGDIYPPAKQRSDNKNNLPFEVLQGQLQGDCEASFLKSFQFMENSPLIGNKSLVVKMLQFFTREQDNNWLNGKIFNIYGRSSTGRKSIALFFVNLLINKKICNKYIQKNFTKVKDLKGITSQNQEKTFYILIHQNSNTSVSLKESLMSPTSMQYLINEQQLTEEMIPKSLCAILISQRKFKSKGICIEFQSPEPFDKDQFSSYVKLHRFLQPQNKTKLSKYVDKTWADLPKGQNQIIYPFKIDCNEILHTLKQSKYDNAELYQLALKIIPTTWLNYYLFIAGVIRETIERCSSRNLLFHEQINNFLKQCRNYKRLFFKEEKQTLKIIKNRKTKSEIRPINKKIKIKRNNQQIQIQITQSSLKEELQNLSNISSYFILIYQQRERDIAGQAIATLKLFIQYTKIEFTDYKQYSTFSYEQVKKNDIQNQNSRFRRIKTGHYTPQIFQATTISKHSYLSRTMEIYEIHELLTINSSIKDQLNCFVSFHGSLFDEHPNNLLFSSKQDYPHFPQHHTHSLPTSRQGRQKHLSVDYGRKISSQSNNGDKGNNEHLYLLMQAGLQFVRNCIGSHLVYNKLSHKQKGQILCLSIVLVNQGVILMKDPFWNQIDRNQVQHSSTSSYQYLMKNSSHDHANTHWNQGKDNRTSLEIDTTSKKSDGGIHQRRLFTYKGLLEILQKIKEQCQKICLYNRKQKQKQIRNENFIIDISIVAQLLAIQINLELNYQMQDNHEKVIFEQTNNNIKNLLNMIELIDIEKSQDLQRDIILSLILLLTKCGRKRLNESVAKEIIFIKNKWDIISPKRRKNSIEYEEVKDIHKLLNKKQLLLKICQDQNIFYKVMEGISFQKYYEDQKESYKKNIELQKLVNYQCSSQRNITQSIKSSSSFIRSLNQIELYEYLLQLYYEFRDRNLSNMINNYETTHKIFLKFQDYDLINLIQKCSTYLNSFRESLLKPISQQLKSLKKQLFILLEANSLSASRSYDIDSMSQQNREYRTQVKENLVEYINLLNKNSHVKGHKNTGILAVNLKLNQENLISLVKRQGCKFLCINTIMNQNNQKDQIIGETITGAHHIIHRENIVKDLSNAIIPIIFICLPKAQMLANYLIKHCTKKQILYFDFKDYENKSEHNHYHHKNCEIVTFQRMIMIETIKRIMKLVVDNIKIDGHSSLGLQQAYRIVCQTTSFIINDKKGNKMYEINNENYRKIIFLYPKQKQEQQNINEYNKIQIIKLQCQNIIQNKQIEEIKRIINRKKNIYDNKQIQIQLKVEINKFLYVLEYYLRDKLYYQKFQIIDISQLKCVKGQNIPTNYENKKKSNKSIENAKKLNNSHSFDENNNEQDKTNNIFTLILNKNILDLYFSTKKVVIIFQHIELLQDNDWTLKQFKNLFKWQFNGYKQRNITSIKLKILHDKIQQILKIYFLQ